MDPVVRYLSATEPVEGPPSCLYPLLLTCRRYYDLLSPSTNSDLHNELFQRKFDFGAPERRIPREYRLPSHVASELQRRFRALRVIRSGDLDHPDALQSLYTAHVMLLEDDGKNAAQLRWARLNEFLDLYFSRYLQSPVELASQSLPMDEKCSLLIAIAWRWSAHGTHSCLSSYASDVSPSPKLGVDRWSGRDQYGVYRPSREISLVLEPVSAWTLLGRCFLS
jgi:hypothetical protein